MVAALKGILTLQDFEFKDERVFLRLDLNVPIKNGHITDETRIQAALPTLNYLLEYGAKLVVASHLGRPKSNDDRGALSLEPIAKRITELLQVDIDLVEDPASDAPKALLTGPRKRKIVLLENLRFDPGEEKNSIELAKAWAEYTDIYINDAFGASHRAHASIVALPELISKHGAGFLMHKEIEVLGGLLESPQRPFLAILGGAKVSDKIGVIENIIDRVDEFLIGGAMAYTFLAAKKIPVGISRVEKAKIKFASELIDRIESRNKKIHLPLDHLVVSKLDVGAQTQTTKDAEIPEGKMAVDIGPKTISAFSKVISQSKTILWNGPMGIFETPAYSRGTFGVAKALAESGATTVVGGGDSAAAMNSSGFADKITHISTGGGASLEFLQGDKLPGLEVLREKVRGTS